MAYNTSRRNFKNMKPLLDDMIAAQGERITWKLTESATLVRHKLYGALKAAAQFDAVYTQLMDAYELRVPAEDPFVLSAEPRTALTAKLMIITGKQVTITVSDQADTFKIGPTMSDPAVDHIIVRKWSPPDEVLVYVTQHDPTWFVCKMDKYILITKREEYREYEWKPQT